MYINIYRNIYICIGYHMRGEVISVLSLKRRYHILTRAIKLILPSLECDNLFITYLCLYLEQKPDYIFKLFILRVHLKYAKQVEITKTNQK